MRSFEMPARAAMVGFALVIGCLSFAVTSAFAQPVASRTGGASQDLPAVFVEAPTKRRRVAEAVQPRSGRPGSAVRRLARASNPPVVVTPAPTVGIEASRLPTPYAGGQVARGSRIGILGNRDYMATPFSTASYTEKTILNQQATSAAEVLTNSDPSVRAAIGSGNRYDALTIRGFRTENSEFLLNGIYGLVPNFRVNPAPIERIELLKGPAAFLNGIAPEGSIGGTVNVVTKRAGDDPITRMTAGYLSDARFVNAYDVGRRYGDRKEWGLRFNGAFDAGRTTIDRQSVLNGVASLGADYRDDRLRVSTDIIYQEDNMRAAARGYIPVPGIAMPAAPDPRINLAQRFDYSHASSVTILTRAEYDLAPNFSLFGAIGANRFAYDKQEAPGATLLNTAGDAQSTSRFQTGGSNAVSGEAGARARFNVGPFDHEFVLSGSALQRSNTFGQTAYGNYLSNIYRPILLATPGLIVSSFAEGRSGSLGLQSVGVADTISVLSGFAQLTVGVRRQQVASSSFNPVTGATTASYDQGATSPSVGLVIRPIREVSFYGNYIEGLSPGPTPPSAASNPTQVFAPSKSKQSEVGTKLDLDRIGATLSVFQITNPTGVLAPITNIFSLDGEQVNRGVELTTFGVVTPGLRILGGVTFLDARLTRTAGGLNDGHRAIGAPNVQGNIGLEWDTPVPGLTATGRIIHTGRAFVSADNLQSVPDWTTVDLGMRYATQLAGRPTTFRATVTNLFDRYYFIGNPTGYVISGLGRAALVSMTIDF